MAHKHTCLRCGKVIAEGNFDCELDRDHDWALCDDCYLSDPHFLEDPLKEDKE
jgi:hypothetical protein